LDKFLDSDENIDQTQPEDRSLHEETGNDGSKPGITVKNVIVFPDPQPGQNEKEGTDLERVNDVEKMQKPGCTQTEALPITHGLGLRRLE
jgi:hypothetical protein